MKKNIIDEIEIPEDDDENVGQGAPKKKREKRRKTKEERAKDRKVVFWTMVVVFLITIIFWILPYFQGKRFEMPRFELGNSTQKSIDEGSYKEYNNL